MQRRHFFFGSMAAGLSACTSLSATHGESRNSFTIPGTLRFSDGEDIAGLNVHIVPQVSVGQLAQLTGGYLIRFDDKWQPYPELLERIPSQKNGDISSDGLEITYRLKKGLVWSDGHPLRADDVAFSFQAVNNPKNNEYSRDGFDLIVDMAERDDYTLTIKLKHPYGSYYETYFSSQNTPLLPKHLLGSLPDINTAPFNALPIGAGPFKFTAWRRNDAVEMVANERYYRGRPKLDKIVYKIVPDWNTVESLVRTGALDVAWLVPNNIVDRLETATGFAHVGQPSGLRAQMQFNVASPVLKDVAVRRALRLAIDRAALVAKVEHGHGDLSDATLGPLSEFAARIPATPYDPKAAAAMLQSAGWLAGADGLRHKDGTTLAVEISTINGSPERDIWLILIQSWWTAIGIKTTIKHYPPSVLFGPYAANGIFQKGRYEAGVDEQGYPFSGNLDTIFACNQFPPGGFNAARYCNPALDVLMEKFDSTYDFTERKRLAAIIQETLAHDVPVIPLFYPQDNYVYNTDLKHLSPVANLDDAFNWSI